jgi:CheY-like chemotaxis protein
MSRPERTESRMSLPPQHLSLPPTRRGLGTIDAPTVASEVPTNAEHSAPNAHAGRYRRVLLVEDEVTLRRVIARNLTSRGIEVHEAGTAGEAVESAVADRPDLLLLEINLPDQTGWEVLRELKRRGSEVPTIVVSAVRVNPSRLSEFHPLAYLPKPFPIDALLRLVLHGRDTDVRSDEEL